LPTDQGIRNLIKEIREKALNFDKFKEFYIKLLVSYKHYQTISRLVLFVEALLVYLSHGNG